MTSTIATHCEMPSGRIECVRARTITVLIIGAVAVGCSSGSSSAQPALDNDRIVASCIKFGDADSPPDATLCAVEQSGEIVDLAGEGIVPGARPALSPNRRHIAAATGTALGIFTVEGELVETIDVEAEASTWLNDSTLAVQSGEPDRATVQIIDADGTDDARPLLDATMTERNIEVGIDAAPDGTTVAYCERIGDESRLMAIAVETREKRVLARSTEFLQWPAYSPDGKEIAVAVGQHIEILDVASGATVMTIEDIQGLTTPSWSPDGDEIAYVDARGALVLAQRSDGKRRALVDYTNGNFDARFPALPAWT